MTRKEIYAEIKKMNLQDEVKKFFGMNYTNVSTANLEYLVHKFEFKTGTSTEIPSRLNKLIEVLEKKRILLKSEVDYINQ